MQETDRNTNKVQAFFCGIRFSGLFFFVNNGACVNAIPKTRWRSLAFEKMTKMGTAHSTQQLYSVASVGVQRIVFDAFFRCRKRRKAAAGIKLCRGAEQNVAASGANVNAFA